ncbi:hypothetical protein OVS_03660 [Mycoplasma ovis str. Michigan]|uniref:Uncharacterized protein n=1 Tax=Mycoplasma ovis str. Michigan TaxID=1415773 RepID=A0ABM5P2F0_9MOLU|nr:hypothetical protein [Mycoplasma ovis]AHC40480.1 hypothetical protein OVS_03660 [Mycoplasma ovis str. Michigan]
MFFLGGALVKGKIAYLCISLLGLSTGVGLVSAEARQNLVSQALGKLGGWVAKIFNYYGASSSPPVPSEPVDPIPRLTQAWGKVSDVATNIIGIVPMSYQWIKTEGNSKFLMNFFKNFWNYSFLENLVFNFHLTLKAWLGLLVDYEALSKFPDAFKTFKVLAQALSKDEQQDGKEIINWLYIRLAINPRRMITILKRGQKDGRKQKIEKEEHLKCNGAKKEKKPKKAKGDNLPLGICFIEKDKNKLIQEMTDFLKEGKIPEQSKKEE